MALWIKKPAVILTVATVAFVGFIILPVVAAIQNQRYDSSALGRESDVNDRDGAEFAIDSTLSLVPSRSPSEVPSSFPSSFPSSLPSSVPSKVPSNVPSNVPSSIPSDVPTTNPTDFATILPTTPLVSVGSDFPSIAPPPTWSTLLPTTLDEMTDVRKKLRKQRALLNAN